MLFLCYRDAEKYFIFCLIIIKKYGIIVMLVFLNVLCNKRFLFFIMSNNSASSCLVATAILLKSVPDVRLPRRRIYDIL